MSSWKAEVRTSPYVMLSSDYSAQEPRITAYVSSDPKMIQSFQEGKDIYASIASVAFKVPYEKCLEFHPETGEYQPDGKARRGEAKFIVLGICYGRSVPSIGEQLYGTRTDMTDEEKTKEAQRVFDSVMNSFPNLRALMVNSQEKARKLGYTETILGRRRHLPGMQLPEFEFKAMKNYVNPDVDPLDISTLQNKNQIPDRIVKQLTEEFKKYKYFGQIARRTRELYEEGIKVINNRSKINDATRQVVNCVDYETEILTTHGWKKHDQVKIGDEILSFDLVSHKIVRDTIQEVHDYPGDIITYQFSNDDISAISTPDHRWITNRAGSPKVTYTQNLFNITSISPVYRILKIADNDLDGNSHFTDTQLVILGWSFASNIIPEDNYHMKIYAPVTTKTEKHIYENILSTLDRSKISIEKDELQDNIFHVITIGYTDFIDTANRFTNNTGKLTFEFVSTLSQHQAKILLKAYKQLKVFTYTEEEKDVVQYLCVVAGVSSRSRVLWKDKNGTRYMVSTRKSKSVRIGTYDKHMTKSDGVWCVTTNTSTWIARREGHVYITGNSIIQGSAADQTKMAILELEHNERWKEIGGRILVPVHDELVAEVPNRYWKEGGEILSKCMCDAASFLPFPSKCDVTTTLRWYGLEYPCQYKKPDSFDGDLDKLSEDEIKWVQYHLYDLEYQLPVFKNSDGSKPRGDAALGVNGVISDELKKAINTYLDKRKLKPEDFIHDIEHRVVTGRYQE